MRGIRTLVCTISVPHGAQDFVEVGGVLRVLVPDQVGVGGLCVSGVRGQVGGGLADPGRGGVCGGAEDPDAAGGVFDDGEDVLTLPGQGDGLNEVAGHEGIGLGAQEVGPGGGGPVGCGVDALGLED